MLHVSLKSVYKEECNLTSMLINVIPKKSVIFSLQSLGLVQRTWELCFTNLLKNEYHWSRHLLVDCRCRCSLVCPATLYWDSQWDRQVGAYSLITWKIFMCTLSYTRLHVWYEQFFPCHLMHISSRHSNKRYHERTRILVWPHIK